LNASLYTQELHSFQVRYLQKEPACRYFHQAGANRFHPAWLQALRQTKTAKPGVEIVRRHADLQLDLIGLKGCAAHFMAGKAVLCFFNKVLHSPAAAVDTYDILVVRRWLSGE
jgi:hypothetical protein